jgi:hypothetical protein
MEMSARVRDVLESIVDPHEVEKGPVAVGVELGAVLALLATLFRLLLRKKRNRILIRIATTDSSIRNIKHL